MSLHAAAYITRYGRTRTGSSSWGACVEDEAGRKVASADGDGWTEDEAQAAALQLRELVQQWMERRPSAVREES